MTNNATLVRKLGHGVVYAENCAAAARTALTTGRYTDARRNLELAERAIENTARRYSELQTYTPTATRYMDRADKLGLVLGDLTADIRDIDRAYAVTTGYDHGAPDHWTPEAAPAPALTSVIVVRAAYTDTPDKVIAPRDGESFEDTILRYYPQAENIGVDSFDHPGTANGYYADRVHITY